MNEPPAGERWSVLPLYLDSVVYPDWHPRFGEVGPVYAYLVEDDEHLFLVDTGIGPAHPLIDRLYQPTRRDIVAALAQNNGIEPRDIDAIVISHLHFDHVGGAQFFAGTPIYVQRAEREAAQAPQYTIPEWLDFPAANWRLLDGDAELAPGLSVVWSPGHTPGHQAVAVNVPAGTVLLAGQAFETRRDWEAMLANGPADETARKLRDIEPLAVLFSHDHAQWWREMP